jgi:hypothetical protein
MAPDTLIRVKMLLNLMGNLFNIKWRWFNRKKFEEQALDSDTRRPFSHDNLKVHKISETDHTYASSEFKSQVAATIAGFILGLSL